VTVDADYLTTPDFLSKAAAALARTGADYVQFPQAYLRRNDLAAGVDMALEEYFRSDAHMADGAEAVLLTGTFCVVAKAALMAIGGWSGRKTTEDAELGVRLCRTGYRGRYIADIVGKDRLPLSLRDLGPQRHRWASGNLRTLILHLPSL
jgi:cellulose synthase/poly-beta-1,6-N-acetylglucosamine synthase-like glycosyltransferase